MNEKTDVVRLSAAEKDAKFGKTYELAKKARSAHSELTKARKSGGANVDVLEAAANKIDSEVKVLTKNYTMGDLLMALAYFQSAIFQDNLSGDGKTFNYGQATWEAKVLMSLPDSRELEPEKKDLRSSLSELRQRSIEVVVKVCKMLGFVPRYGMNDRLVRQLVERLDRKHEEAQANSARATAKEIREVKNELTTSVPKSWLAPRKDYASKAGFTTAQIVGAEGETEVAPAHASTKPEKPAGSRRGHTR